MLKRLPQAALKEWKAKQEKVTRDLKEKLSKIKVHARSEEAEHAITAQKLKRTEELLVRTEKQLKEEQRRTSALEKENRDFKRKQSALMSDNKHLRDIMAGKKKQLTESARLLEEVSADMCTHLCALKQSRTRLQQDLNARLVKT